MAKLIGQHWEGDVRVRWYDNNGEIAVERSQDAQNVVAAVAATNSAGAPTIDGLGKPVAEIPMVVLIDWCAKRGIPWEKMAYSNEYDVEFKQLAAEHTKLRYDNTPSVFTVQ